MNLNKSLILVLLCTCSAVALANTKFDLSQEVKIAAANSYADLKIGRAHV